jgi:hypothetical protein
MDISEYESDCPTRHFVVGRLLLFNAMAFLGTLLVSNRTISRKFRLSHRRVVDPKGTIDFGFLGLMAKLAANLAFVYLTAALTRPENSKDFVWDYFMLWAMRPRATPFIAALGYSRKWTGQAISSFVTDIVICIIAIRFPGSTMVLGGDFEDNKGSWPPYRIGALIAIIPLVLLAIFGLILLSFLIPATVCAIIGQACLLLCKLCTRGRDNEDEDSGVMPWDWSEDWGWYTGYLLLFIVMYIGRWMLWSGIPPELYCPIWSVKVDLIGALGPFGIQILMNLMDGISA